MSDLAAFSNRLLKNVKHWSKWAKRQGITCYRLYDRDIPQFPFAIDWYEGRIHLQEYDTGWQMTDSAYTAWIEAVRQATAEVLALPIAAIFFKYRQRQAGASQYQKIQSQGEDFIVQEGGHRFIVNLQQYLDTGLFLDHRHTRQMVERSANGKRFLNLFAYTGSFTVYAAKGGAASSVSVDLSNTYLAWAKRNVELNGLDLHRHSLVRADVFSFLRAAVKQREQFDLIVLDPPSFSNSAKMSSILDVQRDYPLLLQQCFALLSPGGQLFFSTNLRSFQFAPAEAGQFSVEALSHYTVPADFRNKKIHQSWRLSKLN